MIRRRRENTTYAKLTKLEHHVVGSPAPTELSRLARIGMRYALQKTEVVYFPIINDVVLFLCSLYDPFHDDGREALYRIWHERPGDREKVKTFVDEQTRAMVNAIRDQHRGTIDHSQIYYACYRLGYLLEHSPWKPPRVAESEPSEELAEEQPFTLEEVLTLLRRENERRKARSLILAELREIKPPKSGQFSIGTSSDEEPWSTPKEQVPAGQRLEFALKESYWMMRVPVTNEMYLLYDPTYQPVHPGPDYPVTAVDWTHAELFARWIGLVLPTEPLWEYAASGGFSNRPFYNCNMANWQELPPSVKVRRMQEALGECGWYLMNSDVQPREVGGRERSSDHPFGLCDIHGNVWEWCADGYWNYEPVARAGAVADPFEVRGPWSKIQESWRQAMGTFPIDPERRAVRGGSFRQDMTECRVTYRLHEKQAVDDVGFRLMASAGMKVDLERLTSL